MEGKQARSISLDILRGLALAGMLLVNNPGSWSHVYWPLLHAPWHGLTPTDLVFPFFLFVVGGAMVFSLKQQIENRQFNWSSITRRSVLLILIGILLSAIPYQAPLSEWRIPGVLQRIGLCFFLACLVLRFLTSRQTVLFCLASLVAYWISLIMYTNDPYSMQQNLVRFVDLLILGESHMYKGLGFAFDPEGLLSSVPATITVLSGYLITLYVQSSSTDSQKIKRLLGVGGACIAIGLLWSISFPINKSLWTSTYVLVTTGIACILLALIIAYCDVANKRFGLMWLKIYGSNPILLFVLAGIVARALNMVKLEHDGGLISIKAFIFEQLNTFLPEKIASLVFALGFMLVFYLLALYLYKRNIFIKL